jgi:hypothetical protein
MQNPLPVTVHQLTDLVCDIHSSRTVLPDFPDPDTIAYMAGMLTDGDSEDVAEGLTELLDECVCFGTKPSATALLTPPTLTPTLMWNGVNVGC